MVTEYQALIAADVKTDTRKLATFEAFHKGVATLRTFVEERRAFLLKYYERGAKAKAPALQASVARGLQAYVARGL
jgi:hypothetical protein